MCTPAKKHYAGILLAQEGIIFKKRKLDMKGISIRKSSFNKNIRDYFEKILVDKILTPEEINLADIYGEFNKISKEISDCLKNGKTTYVYPAKVNSISNYAAPYSIQQLRGALLWNVLFPDNPINMPDKINYIKLKPMPYNEFISKIPDHYKNDILNLLTKHPAKNGNKGLGDYPVSILTMPKNVKKIPDFIVPLIDIDTVIHDQLKAGIELIEPLGFKKLNINDNSYTTNIINL